MSWTARTAALGFASATACTSPSGTGSAGGSSGGTADLGSTTTPLPPPPTASDVSSTGSDAGEDEGTTGTDVCPNLLANGGFEGGWDSPYWYTDSTLFGTPLCNPACRDGAADGAHEGLWWLWFGGDERGESAHAAQVVRVPSGVASFSFHLRIPEAAGTGDDLLVVLVDGQSRRWIYDTEAARYAEYLRVTLDLSEIADDDEHEIGFGANFPGTGITSFYVDTVRLEPCLPPPGPEVPPTFRPAPRPAGR